MVTVANPIYDVVFKYLMEDMRVARTILSAFSPAELCQLIQEDNVKMLKTVKESLRLSMLITAYLKKLPLKKVFHQNSIETKLS